MVAVEFELLGVIAAARLECGEPATEAGELIRPGDCFGDLFDFHVALYSTAKRRRAADPWSAFGGKADIVISRRYVRF